MILRGGGFSPDQIKGADVDPGQGMHENTDEYRLTPAPES